MPGHAANIWMNSSKVGAEPIGAVLFFFGLMARWAFFLAGFGRDKMYCWMR